jgi:hypothetical protein
MQAQSLGAVARHVSATTRTIWVAIALSFVFIGISAVLPGHAQAQSFRFTSVVVEGNQQIDTQAIVGFARIARSRAVSAAELNAAYQRVVATGFFRSVDFVPSGNRLVIRVEEYPLLGAVALEGNRRLNDEALRAVIRSRPGGVYSPSLAEQDANAIAEAYANRGAEVVLVCGPSSISSSNLVQRIDVTSAQEMFSAVEKHLDYDIAVLSAAVADYTPVEYSDEKIKKSGENLVIELQKTKDILAYLGAHKKHTQFLVGFAMETQNLEENARLKLKNKNADLIVLNSLKEEGAGFKHDTNKVYLVSLNQTKALPLLSKQQVAEIIVDETVAIQN